MIAFVGSSMANTSEVKVAEEKEAAAVSQCSDVYQATYIMAKRQGANDTQAGATAWAAYSACLESSPSQSTQP